MTENFRWRKIKKSDIPLIEKMLLDVENDYVGACGRFLSREESSKEPVWLLCEKNDKVCGMVLNSKSTVLPVLRGKKEIPPPDFIKGFLRTKKIHSVQGLKSEVLMLEDAIKSAGRKASDIIDYDLMSLDKQPEGGGSSAPSNLVLRVPQMIDIDEMAPLQAAYEKEEVLPKGSVFSPASSRINTTNIIAKGQVLSAQINGKLVGKINVSAVSFTRYQVGGVYVHPNFRGQGIGRKMAFEFISSLISQGRGVTLFVKKSNAAARRLYASLGFTIRNDYRITYY